MNNSTVKIRNLLNSNGYTLHILLLAAILLKLVISFGNADILRFLTIMLIVIPPGLYILKNIITVDTLFPFAIGAAAGVGLILQGLLYFALTITSTQKYYMPSATIISLIACILLIFHCRNVQYKPVTAHFDLLHLLLYLGLFIGLGNFAASYGNLFNSNVTAGLISTPLLEVHSSGYANYALNYGAHPFFTIFGWPLVPVEIPFKIGNLPMPGILIRSLSVWCNGDLLLGLYATHLLALISVVSASGMLCHFLFNRYAATLVSVIFVLHYTPSGGTDYILYLPVMLSLMGTTILILFLILQENLDNKFGFGFAILFGLITSFLILTHNQFMMVYCPAFFIYLLCHYLRHHSHGSGSMYLLVIACSVTAFMMAVMQHGRIYPTLEFTPWDTRKAIIEFNLFQNIGYLYPNVTRSLDDFKKTILRYDFIFVLIGIASVASRLLPRKKTDYKLTHVFICAGILISVLFGNIFDFEAGKSSLLFFMFSLYFLFVYGVAAISVNRKIAVCASSVIIIGSFVYPKYYKQVHHGEGYVQKQTYDACRKISDALPEGARLLVLSDELIDFYVGYDEAPTPQKKEQQTQRAYEMITGHRCVYHNAGNISANLPDDTIKSKITTYKLTHVVTDRSRMNIFASQSDIVAVNWKQISDFNGKPLYLAELKYDKYFSRI